MVTHKVKMLKTQSGSRNGIEIELFESGKIYSISTDLASVFVNQLKVAEYVIDMPTRKGEDNLILAKMETISPENKMETVSEDKEEEIEIPQPKKFKIRRK